MLANFTPTDGHENQLIVVLAVGAHGLYSNCSVSISMVINLAVIVWIREWHFIVLCWKIVWFGMFDCIPPMLLPTADAADPSHIFIINWPGCALLNIIYVCAE